MLVDFSQSGHAVVEMNSVCLFIELYSIYESDLRVWKTKQPSLNKEFLKSSEKSGDCKDSAFLFI